MATPPPDSSPPYSGLGHIPGLDRDKVEKERKDMWGQIFKKYEDLDQRNELTGEVSLEDIDTLNNILYINILQIEAKSEWLNREITSNKVTKISKYLN